MFFGIKENRWFWPIQCIFGYCWFCVPGSHSVSSARSEAQIIYYMRIITLWLLIFFLAIFSASFSGSDDFVLWLVRCKRCLFANDWYDIPSKIYNWGWKLSYWVTLLLLEVDWHDICFHFKPSIRAVTIHQTHDSVRITIFSWGVGEKKRNILKQYFLLNNIWKIFINWTPKNKINYANY